MIARVWDALLKAAPVKVWAQIGAAMVFTAMIAGVGMIIWKGPWAPDRQTQQLELLGWGMFCVSGLTLVALVAITGLQVNLHGGKDGVTASIDQDDAKTATVETVTTTTVKPSEAT